MCVVYTCIRLMWIIAVVIWFKQVYNCAKTFTFKWIGIKGGIPEAYNWVLNVLIYVKLKCINKLVR